MCGICGVYGLEDKKLIKRMSYVIQHRGPDDSGFYTNKNIMLGHRRLSILDLKTGKQPIYNENKDKVIVYNGEVYNFQEIREKLEKKGHRFYTNSDTEVIIHAYEEYGDNCVAMLNGEFAFAIWDNTKKELFLARDRAGVKPLYYYFKNGIFIFASEIKSILQYNGVRREVDIESVHYLFNLRYIPKEKTIFRDIKKLLPGYTLTFTNKGVVTKQYWKPEIKTEKKPIDYYIDKLKKTLQESIERYLISDVPVGAFLSGGLDTSTIVYFATKVLDRPLQTFCMGFNEPTDEFKDARMIAEKFNTDHKEIIVKFDLVKSLPKTIWAIDTPKRNMWPYFINKEASKYTKVILGGSGGDEIFGGYIYRYNFTEGILKLRKKGVTKENIKKADLKIRKQIESGNIENDYQIKEWGKIRSINDDTSLYLLNTHMNKLYSNPAYLKNIYGEKLLKNNLPDVRNIFEPYFKEKNICLIEKQFLVEFATKMVDDLLTVDDATSMIHSLEGRAPLLDKELIELCFKIPTEYKICQGEGKFILRKAMKDILPKRIIKKKKWGFIPNTYSWFKNDFRDLALGILPNGNIIREGFFKKEIVQKILNHKLDKRLSMYYNFIWDMITFEIWYKIYIENDNLYKPNLNMDYLF